MLTVDAPCHGARDRERRAGFRLPPGMTAVNLAGLPALSHPAGQGPQARLQVSHFQKDGHLVVTVRGRIGAARGLSLRELPWRPIAAATVVTTVPAVGTILSVALLSVPALTARLVTRRVGTAMVAGAAYGAAGGVLGLTASAGFRRSDLADLLTVPSRYWSLGPTLAASLFDAGARKAAVSQSQAAWEQAVATYRQTVLVAFQEVEDNLAAARLLEEAAVEQSAAVAAAAQAEAIALNQYRAGTVAYLNVIVLQAAHLSAQRSANDLAARRLVAAVLLAKNAGGSVASAYPSTASPRKD